MIVATLLSSAGAQELPFEQYEMHNGLVVVLHEDHALPQVVVDVWYRVGSKDEAPGRSGFAHLFEHLMFMGTERLPGNGIDVTMETHGGWNNAFTYEDGTNYYDVGPSNLLPLLLWIEADRMEGLGRAMTQEKLDLQRDVVRNERRQNTEDRPYGSVRLHTPRMMYPAEHPYAHSVIGSHEDLQAATLHDVKDFFSTWYVPDQAVLVVAGDFDPAVAKEQIASLFGKIPRGATARARPAPEPVTAPIDPEETIEDRVDAPQLNLYWHTAEAFSDADAELTLLADLLGGGESSRLYRQLVLTGRAQDLTVYQDGLDWGGQFVVRVTAMPGVSVEDLQATVTAELARLAVEPPTEGEMERLRNQTEYETLSSLQTLQDRALRLAQYAAYTGDPGWLDEDLARFRQATPRGLSAAAKKWLVDGKPARVIVVPRAEE